MSISRFASPKREICTVDRRVYYTLCRDIKLLWVLMQTLHIAPALVSRLSAFRVTLLAWGPKQVALSDGKLHFQVKEKTYRKCLDYLDVNG